MFRTPKRTKEQGGGCAMVEVTPPPPSRLLFKMETPESSPAAGLHSSPSPNLHSTLSPNGETRRGRPRAENLNTLIMQGSTSPSSIKCTFCNRVFPREKSLQAHLRTHTGEKPYICDFPRCTKRFAQSGQLKTHQRLHTGEKPFICAAPFCERRFTHANRHCPEHPDLQLRRYNATANVSVENIDDEQYKQEIHKWMAVKKREKTETGSSTPKKSRAYENWLFDPEPNENVNTENIQTSKAAKVRSSQELTYGYAPFMVKQELDETKSLELPKSLAVNPVFKLPFLGEEVELDLSSTAAKPMTELPKKRWLREAVLEQQRFESTQDLALPINWGEESKIIEHENQKRPTVLVKIGSAEKPKSIPSSDMQVAMALVELGNLPPNNSASYFY